MATLTMRPIPSAGGKRTGRAWVSGLITAGLAGALLLTLSIVVAGGLGYRTVVIKSGSMTPSLPIGALVLSRSTPPLAIRPGDVVTFHSPSLGGDLVTHRVVSTSAQGGVVHFVTKGDANSVSENWSAGRDRRVGLAVGHLPFVGWWFAILQTGTGRVAIIALACVWVAMVAIPRIWAGA